MSFAYECIKRLIGLLMILAFVAASGSACRASLDITLDTATVSFGALDKSDLDVGFMEQTAAGSTYALRVTAIDTVPQNWTLSTRASDAYFTASDGGVKPCSDLQWRLNGPGSYIPFTISDAVAATGNGNATVDFDFKMLTSWADKPGTYNIEIVYTISSP